MSTNGETGLPIIIAGAGIGGLTAALCLHAQGHEIVLMDRARQLSEVGAGLQLSPNACSVLDQLGLLEDLAPHAYAPDFIKICSAKSGEELARVTMGTFLKERHGYPFWEIHRADLQRVLLEKVQASDGISLRLSSEVIDLESSPYEHLTCVFQDDEISGNLRCRALVGADGVWSRTRRLIPGHEDAHYSGQVAYRATVPIDAVPERWRRDAGLWFHKSAHLVHYPVRGGRELNIVGLVEEAWEDETWSAKANKETLLKIFRDWPTEVRNLLTIPDAWLKWALCSVDAGGPWTHGNIALIGDAAHAMLPFMAQGAAMSIEDAAILAEHLPQDVENIPAAFRAFERQRKQRVQHIQGISFRNARTFHYGGAMAFARDTVLRLSKPTSLAARFDDIYGWTPGQ
ncbi:FAD-dependent monooxygenase [Roseibium aggregatum]|uniref:FAD-dependent monooxygenase n=1 Tax=Roseibium aggregatum TaxID=187304 RepID=UPI001A8C629B|nr:FAD-dependent monooxygenase [Roseibium aggregatum]MBN8182492.1 FAD-dependent monooxygenase [Roseibium aggregatum]